MQRRVVDIDVSAVTNSDALHELLASKLGFPHYYGRNWDAFDECISDAELPLPHTVRVQGVENLRTRLPREAELLRKCATNPDAIPTFEWCQ